MSPSSPENCPHCGADVPANAQACPECGSTDETGWSEEAYVGQLGIPDEDFDYEDYVQREFGKKQPVSKKPLWAVTALVVLLVIAFLFLLR